MVFSCQYCSEMKAAIYKKENVEVCMATNPPTIITDPSRPLRTCPRLDDEEDRIELTIQKIEKGYV